MPEADDKEDAEQQRAKKDSARDIDDFLDGDSEPEGDLLMMPPGTADWEREEDDRRGWSGPTLAFLIFLFAAFIAGGLYKGIDNARKAADRARCTCHFSQIGLALSLYTDANGSLPPAYLTDDAGRPTHSWRALILPYFNEELARAYSFDEPWDGPNNTKLHNRMPKTFRCPSDTDAPEGRTNYVAVVGPETMWPPGRGRRFSEVADGSSSTILLVEVKDANICWLEPRDLNFDTMDFTINGRRGESMSSHHPVGVMAIMADDDRTFLPNNTPPETVRAMLTVAGGEKISDKSP